jgi:hypothetical protein
MSATSTSTSERIRTAQSTAERVERDAALAGAVLETAGEVMETLEDVAASAAEVERKARRWLPKVLIVLAVGTLVLVVVRRVRRKDESEAPDQA